MNLRRILLRKEFFVLICVLFFLTIFYQSNLSQSITLSYFQQHLVEYQQEVESHYWFSILVFGLIFVFLVTISFPATTILTFLSGALFGTFVGTIVVTFSASLGATFSFLIARYLLSDFFRNIFSQAFIKIDRLVEAEGVWALITLRMVPSLPFFVINPVMGLTKMKVKTYYLATTTSMFLPTMVFVHAGQEISKLQSATDIFSARVLMSLLSVAMVPFILRWILSKQKRLKQKLR